MKRDMEKNIEALIDSYISCAGRMCDIIMKSFVLPDGILRGRRLGIVPKEGVIGDVHYIFHGAGCYFEFKDGHIDIDFGPENRCDGFDAYRLYDYLCAMSSSQRVDFFGLENEDQLECELHLLVTKGVIIKPNLMPNDHLYYLKNRW